MKNIRQYLIQVFFLLNSIPIVSSLIFINYATLKVLEISEGGLLSSLLLLINTLISALNILCANYFNAWSVRTKIRFYAIVSCVSSIVIFSFMHTAPIGLKTFLVFILLFFCNSALQQSQILLFFKIPYFLDQERLLALHKSTALSLIIERISRGIAPGIALILINLDWSIVCSLYAIGNLLGVVAVSVLKHSLNDIQLDKVGTINQEVSVAHEAQLRYKNTAIWHNAFQFLINFFIAPATFVYLYAIKLNSHLQVGIITPLLLLYSGVLVISLIVYFKKFNTQSKLWFTDPFKCLSISCSILGLLFLALSLSQGLAFWVLSLLIGIVYGLILLINSNEVLKILHKSDSFLKYIAHSQFYTMLSVVPSFIIVGYLIDNKIHYQYLFGIIGAGCIVSALSLLYLRYFLKLKTIFIA